MRIRSTLVLLAWWLLAGRSAAAIVLSQDFDSGSLNVAASTVNGNTVNLVGRRTWTEYPSNYRWVYFRASGVASLAPQFTISSSLFLGDLSDHRYLYSYDQSDWRYFDNCYVSNSTYYFSNNTPFTGNDVYVAYSTPYPFSRTQALVSTIAQSPFVCPTTSGAGDLLIGQTSGGIDDLGRTIAPNDLYALKIRDASQSGPKTKVLLAGGNHSCETPGSHALEGAIEFLLGDAPEAKWLRRVAEFYVYPQVNPDGREAGYYRSSVENPSKDFNRYWSNPTGFTDMTTVRNAMVLDTGGDIEYLFDFHSMFGAWYRNPYYEVIPSDANSAFAAALAQLEPSIVQSLTVGTLGMLRIWAQTGLDAEHSFTPEFGCHPGVLETRLDEMGADYMRALCRALAPQWDWIPGDATGDGVVDEADAAILATHWGNSGATWLTGDFDRDGRVGPSDAAILAANWGSHTEAIAANVPEPATLALLSVAMLVLTAFRPGRPRRSV